MKETIYDVALAINEAQPKYKNEHIPVVARVHGDFDGVGRDLLVYDGSLKISACT